MKLPVFKAIAATFAYLATHALTVLKAMWLPALLLQAGLVYLMPGYLDAAMSLSAIQSSTDPAEALTAMGPLYSTVGLLLLVNAAFYPMLISGGLRHIIRGDSPRLPFYLQYGGDEVRVLITFVLFSIMASIIYLVGFLGVTVLVAALMALSPALGGIVAAIAFLALIVAFFWFLLRLSMVFPATIGAKAIGLAKSWVITKNNAWRLLFYWFIWAIVLLCVAVVYLVVVWPEYSSLFGEMVANAQDPAAVREVERRMMQMQRDLWDMTKPGFWPAAIATYVYLIVYVALWNTASGIAYRYLAGDTAARA